MDIFSLGVPVAIYRNADTQKGLIYTENKNKSGVYLWRNLINGKCYIGSSKNLRDRFYKYYSLHYLIKINMAICKALLKYGYSNFSLEILEYCEPSECFEKENYYLKLLKPRYNILKEAGISTGFKFTEGSITKIKRSNELTAANSGRSIKIEILDLQTNITTTYISFTEAAKALNISKTNISLYFSREQKKPLLNRYIIKKIQ